MRFECILFPVDFSSYAEACLEAAARYLSEDRPREVHFLYVLHSPTDFSTWTGNPVKEVRYHLEDFIGSRNPAPQAVVETAVQTGHPSTEICKYASSHGCDLIVMATHGRTGLSHMLMGSTAEQVVRHAPCPVLTLRLRPAEVDGSREKRALADATG